MRYELISRKEKRKWRVNYHLRITILFYFSSNSEACSSSVFVATSVEFSPEIP